MINADDVTDGRIETALRTWRRNSGFQDKERMQRVLEQFTTQSTFLRNAETIRQAAERGSPPPPPRHLLCAICIEANRQAEADTIHEGMTIAHGSMVCHEHYDLLVKKVTLADAIDEINKLGAERRREERRKKYEALQDELYQRMREQDERTP